MRTPEQILARIKVEKGSLETLTGQLCACQDKAYIYQDAINFMSEAIRSLSNAVEELEDLNEQSRVLDEVCCGLYTEGGEDND